MLHRGLPLVIERLGYLVVNMCRITDKALVRWELIGVPGEKSHVAHVYNKVRYEIAMYEEPITEGIRPCTSNVTSGDIKT